MQKNMQMLKINGGEPLLGELSVQGAKNSILPMLSACVIVGDKVKLNRCPGLSDVFNTLRILGDLGCRCQRDGKTIIVDASFLDRADISDELMCMMRSSIIFLGPLLSRVGSCTLSLPGGDVLGPRPIDIHIESLKKMGAVITEEHGRLICTCKGRLKGVSLHLNLPSVGATENIMLAAVTADGKTIISNAAKEPEIVDLANFLNKCGAKISGAGSQEIVIEGVERSSLHGCEYTIMPDRIVTATYLCAAAASGGEVMLKDVRSGDMGAALEILRNAGCDIYEYSDRVYLKAKNRLKAVRRIETQPFPGFATDDQAIFMACMAKAEGTTIFIEKIFESRYAHADELNRMGADIEVHGSEAVVRGVERLSGANVKTHDLRGGAALCVAACAAEGETVISCVEHIDRGYESIEDDLRRLGADVVRL